MFFQQQECILKGIIGDLSSDRSDMLTCDHQVDLTNFKIYGSESNKFILELKKSLFIKRDQSNLDRNQFYLAIVIKLTLRHASFIYFMKNLVF